MLITIVMGMVITLLVIGLTLVHTLPATSSCHTTPETPPPPLAKKEEEENSHLNPHSSVVSDRAASRWSQVPLAAELGGGGVQASLDAL
eukprot:1232731-Rhodomonas_salina.2